MERSTTALLFAAATTLLANHAFADTYTTAAAGNWTDGSTWVGGSAPATDVSGDDIVVLHDLTVVNNDIKLMNGATLDASGVAFTMWNGNFTVENGSADFVGCNVLIAHGFNIQITTEDGSLSMIDCEVDVGQNFQNSEGLRYLENVCLVVDENFKNAKGVDTLINVCAVIGNDSSGSFQNDSDSVMHIEESEFHLPNGNFQNQSSATLTGNITAIWLENGNLQNDGTWTATVAHYCVSQDVTVSATYLPPAEDCVGIAAFFDPCECSPPITDCNDNGIDDALDIAGGFPDVDNNGVPDECEPGIDTFCEGTGSNNGGVDCPCGNEAPPGQAQGCANSTGTGASLVATGIPSISNDTMMLTASNFPVGMPGVFFVGNQSQSLPFRSGRLCVGGQTQRMDKIPFGNAGTGVMPAPGFPVLSQLHNVNAGDTLFYQFWYRDPNGLCAGGGANTSNAVQITWGL